MTEKKSFILYFDNEKQINMLNNEQAGQLLKALFKFAKTGEETEFKDLAVNIVFGFIADTIRRDTHKYKEICEKNRKIAVQREKKKRDLKSTDVHERVPENTISTDNDIDNEIEIENVIDNEIVIDNGIEKDMENEKKIDIENRIDGGAGIDNNFSNFAENFQQNLNFNTPSPSSEEESFLNNFNSICKSFNSISKISDIDRQNIHKIISTFTEEEINKTFEKIEKSDFLKGKKKNPDKKYQDWKANFSWIIKYNNFLNAFNGNYDNKSSHNDDDFNIDMYKQFVNDFTCI